MKVLMIPPVLPYHTSGGVAMVNWAILKELRSRGHGVGVAVEGQVKNLEIVQANLNTGAKVFTEIQDFQALVSEWEPDLLFCYSVSGLQKIKDISLSIARVCALVDLDHQVPLYRRQYYYRSKPMTYAELAALHQRGMEIKETVIPLLSQCKSVIEHACHHAKWFQEVAGINAQYIPMPVADPVFPGWIRDERSYPPQADRSGWRMRVAMAGHLGGIATLSGLYFLAEDILPHIGAGAEFRIAGAEKLYPDAATRFKHWLENKTVNLLGYIPDIQKEMLSSHVVLVPTPIDLGFRTRIVEAWSLGCPVVAHSANLLGMPEAESGINLLAADTGEELARLVMELGKDREQQMRIGRKARETYEAHYRNSEAKVVDLIEAALK